MNSTSYVKMLLHAAKYPHCSVNGLFVRKKSKKEDESSRTPMQAKNCIPLFHGNLTLLPMLELALTEVEAYCEEEGLTVCGYYHIHSDINNTLPDIFTHKLMEKLDENYGNVCLVIVDNRKINNEEDEVPYSTYNYVDGRLVPTSSVFMDTEAAERAGKAIQDGLYRDLVDFDNHLDNISLDWRNEHLDK
ncbi:ER membrane protein complex subunit 8-like [Watersipora subatra]|uniref:ER membrane protein complex subunit 8-like n=1 Tax=Watersipora subatra TaxID=2589382 RepID=UPI00355B1B42